MKSRSRRLHAARARDEGYREDFGKSANFECLECQRVLPLLDWDRRSTLAVHTRPDPTPLVMAAGVATGSMAL